MRSQLDRTGATERPCLCSPLDRQRTGGCTAPGGMTTTHLKSERTVMPRKNNNARTSAKQRPLKAVLATEATSAPARTESQDKVWAALHSNPGATTADLAESAKVGRSTAGKILAAWAMDGSVSRITGIADGGRRSADRWTITHTGQTTPLPSTTDTACDDGAAESTDAEEPTNNERNAEARAENPESTDIAQSRSGDLDTPGAVTKGPRLSKGELRGMVEDYLSDHPDEEFSPNTIGKALHRSSGAITNALEKLVADGYALRAQDKPKRFTAAHRGDEAAN
ncbi:MarR family transcriptional regulator [Saccharopolyspora sp. NPDC050389]|uniref:MarR family transcriptional regulator n=1 Tax=Saccharopolyspora sp. NPDC050389 TaxID=3155516 RepID=UPI0033FF3497